MKTTKAFTLIEMLVVIVLIGALMYALLGRGVFFSVDSALPGKMQTVASSWKRCIQDLDMAGVSIDDAKNVLGMLLVDNSSPDEGGNSLSDRRVVAKGKAIDSNGGYQVTAFYEEIKNLTNSADVDRSICRDFIVNYIQDVAQKWSTVNWYIPAGVQGNDIFDYLDTDYGGFLVCGTHKSNKYAYFKDADKNNKFYTCSILGLNGDSVGNKIGVLQAFGGDGKKVLLTNEAIPEIPKN